MDIYTAIRKFTRLKVDRSKGAPAPHKAILLLAIIELVNAGEILYNRIYITPTLVAKFKDLWQSLVHSIKFSPNFALPFFHLRSEGFWHLVTEPGREILLTNSQSIKSFSALKNAVDFAAFDHDFFSLLQNSEHRALLAATLLDTYLHGQQLPRRQFGYLDELEHAILCETSTVYRTKFIEASEEDLFVRGGVFKKVVPKIYNYTCCVSGTRIITANDVQMIDACHIVPFAESHDDTITNGLSLSPTLHRAFDRFLISVTPDYEVVVSDSFMESGPLAIRPFAGTRISLPAEISHRPSQTNLQWHYSKFLSMHR